MATFIDGIASSQAIDTSGEIVDLAGMDISSLVGSVFNYEHESKLPDQIIGKILYVKKIFSEQDAENDRQAYFWQKCQIPFLYCMGELFDDYKESAKEIAGMFQYDSNNKDKLPTLGFSIEGAKIAKEGMIVKASIARKITITVTPANKQCLAEVVPGEDQAPKSKEDDLASIFKTETSVEIQLIKTEDVTKMLELAKIDKSEDHAKALGIKPMNKALKFEHPAGHTPSKEDATPKPAPKKFENYKKEVKGIEHTEVEHVHSHYDGKSPDTVYTKAGHRLDGAQKGKFKAGDKVTVKPHIQGTYLMEHSDMKKADQPKLQAVPAGKSGHSIGRTKSGHDVLSHGKVGEYQNFGSAEHRQAADLHFKAAEKATNPKLGQHHMDKVKLHRQAADSAEHREKRFAVGKEQAAKQAMTMAPKIAQIPGFGGMGQAPPKLKKAQDHSSFHAEADHAKSVSDELHTKGKELGQTGSSHSYSVSKKGVHGAGFKDKKSADSFASHAKSHPGVHSVKQSESHGHHLVDVNIKHLSEMKKTLTAGSGLAAPSALSGGAALGKESLSKASEKGVHQPARGTPTNGGLSEAGVMAIASKDGKAPLKPGGKERQAQVAKQMHSRKLDELKNMPKPNLTKGDILEDNVAQRRQARATEYKKRGDMENHKIAIDGAKESHKEQLISLKNQPKPKLTKSDLLKRAETEYKTWSKREEFEKFMKSKVPSMTKGEIIAFGQTLVLKKSMESEESLESLLRPEIKSLKK